MYHCHICFYLAGHSCMAFEILKEMPLMERFTYEFKESEKPDRTLAAKADMIWVNLQGVDAKEMLRTLVLDRRRESEIILLADREQILQLEDELEDVKDIWTLPMSEKEIRFRLLRWRQAYKKEKDAIKRAIYECIEKGILSETAREGSTILRFFSSLACRYRTIFLPIACTTSE